VNSRIPQVLLVNPWIHDVAAYNFWAAPLGLLTLGAILREHGMRVAYLDCLDRFHPRDPFAKPSKEGRGPYRKSPIPKPPGLKALPRNFCRYGIDPEWFREELGACGRPDLILVTSFMTYWYPGVQETIRVIRDVFPDVPVILGGVYATLCREHACKTSGADQVVSGNGAEKILEIVKNHTGFNAVPRCDPLDMDSLPYPALDLQRKISFVPLLTSRGCPFRCAYCASSILDPRRMRRNPEGVTAEIIYWHDLYGVKDFAFYDDALLVDAEHHIIPLLQGIIRTNLKIRFHTPNALHIREISPKAADMMRQAGFKDLRLGLETSVFENRQNFDRKVTEAEFIRAVECLFRAGFSRSQIGVYLLAGLPGQRLADVEASIMTVKENGITPIIAFYTPIPGTPLWKEAVAVSPYDLESDPIFTNNTLFPCWPQESSWQIITRLKDLIQGE
jgi:radical SAM superfamily enzyme YgiQ (UPF0313 family)